MIEMDSWWDWDDEPATGERLPTHLQLLPTGTHTGELVKVEVRDLKFRQSDKNPGGTSLCLVFSKQGFKPVETNIPLDWRGLLEAVCRSARVPTPQRGVSWDEQALLGRTVTIDLENAIAKSGNEYQRIAKWHKGGELPPAAPTVKAKPPRSASKAAKAFAETAQDDDIPF